MSLQKTLTEIKEIVNNIIENVDWYPKGMDNNSHILMIELKSKFIRISKKIDSIEEKFV